MKTKYLITIVLIIFSVFALTFFFTRFKTASTNYPYSNDVKISNSFIELDTLRNNDTISSPLLIKGKINSSWMFEGRFPIVLLDDKRQPITQTLGEEAVPGSWTQEGMIDFQANLSFSTNAKAGFVVIKKDNPSGLPQNDQSQEIPVRFIATEVGQFCGGIGNIKCPTGYSCQLDGNYPDAGGKCIK
jgi:hypothetical protein